MSSSVCTMLGCREKRLPPQDVKCCTVDARPGNALPPSYQLPDVSKEALQ